MPNHVTTRCIVYGNAGAVQAFRRRMIVFVSAGGSTPGHQAFDFNRIIPMPTILRDTDESSTARIGAALLNLRGSCPAPFETGGLYVTEIAGIRAAVSMPDAPISDVAAALLKQNSIYEEQGLRRLQALTETGFTSWYPWSVRYWGTKWGAYQFDLVSDDPLHFTFQTAWSFPTPVFEALAAEFPSLTFDLCCFDEGWNFAGAGAFNPRLDQPAFALCDATDELYQRVYGQPAEPEED